MSQENRPRSSPLLERVTAAVLLLVVFLLGWVVLAAYQPAWARRLTAEVEVVIVLAVLTAALILVSVVALWHTRS